MRKVVLVLIMTAAISVGAFANHPSGWGVGLVGQGGFAWDGFAGSGGAAFSLKAPRFPLFWGINLDMREHGIGFGVTGDNYIFDNTLVSETNFGWFLGLGVYAGFHSNNYQSTYWTSIRGGARVPIGIYIFPANFLEIFFNLAPSLGVGFYFGDYPDAFHFPEGGAGADFGIRFWF